MDLPYPLRLASASPRRAALLEAAGIPFRVGPIPDVDETVDPGLTPAAQVQALARRKLDAVLGTLRDVLVLTADTLVFDGAVALGKPGGPDDARRMLQSLAGRTHQVVTGLALAGPEASGTWRIESAAVATRVTFRPLTLAEIDAYIATGEPEGKAGAYAIQGGAAAFVTQLDGPRDNVIGLPISALRRLIDRFR